MCELTLAAVMMTEVPDPLTGSSFEAMNIYNPRKLVLLLLWLKGFALTGSALFPPCSLFVAMLLVLSPHSKMDLGLNPSGARGFFVLRLPVLPLADNDTPPPSPSNACLWTETTETREVPTISKQKVHVG